jgi:hypothetical protein
VFRLVATNNRGRLWMLQNQVAVGIGKVGRLLCTTNNSHWESQVKSPVRSACLQGRGCDRVADLASRRDSTRVIAVKAGWLNVTLTNHRNTDALDGVLRTSKKHLCVPDVSPADPH